MLFLVRRPTPIPIISRRGKERKAHCHVPVLVDYQCFLIPLPTKHSCQHCPRGVHRQHGGPSRNEPGRFTGTDRGRRHELCALSCLLGCINTSVHQNIRDTAIWYGRLGIGLCFCKFWKVFFIPLTWI